jgi:hypothetical protein
VEMRGVVGAEMKDEADCEAIIHPVAGLEHV